MATVASRNVARSTGSSQHETYQIAHTAKCKLHIAANRPDRNLRFVLGHAFTLDNLLLRIVEIENHSAKDEFEETKSEHRSSEIQAEDDRRAGVGGGAGVKVRETGSLKKQPQEKQRRVSFGNSANFRPSDLKGGNGNGSPKRNKSPPPAPSSFPVPSKEEESSESEDAAFNPKEFAETLKPQTAVTPRTNVDDKAEVKEEEDEPVDDYDDEEEDDGLGLQRFASASAQPPRRRTSPPPADDVPALSGSDSDEDEQSEPPSPPSLPGDVARKMMAEGEEDETLKGLYNQVRSCTCCPNHAKTPVSQGMKTGMYEGRRVGIVTVEA